MASRRTAKAHSNRVVGHEIVRFLEVDPLDVVSRNKLLDIDRLHRAERDGVQVLVGQENIVVFSARISSKR